MPDTFRGISQLYYHSVKHNSEWRYPMWRVKYSVCLFKGHDCSEMTLAGSDDTFCHRCGRLKPNVRRESAVDRTTMPVENACPEGGAAL